MTPLPGRSNGLPAIRYTPLVDLEPQLADALLEALRDEGVAAYAAPSPGVKGPYQDVTLPDRPTDRVWVDEDARSRAGEVLSARMPEFHDAITHDSVSKDSVTKDSVSKDSGTQDEHGHAPPPAPKAAPGRGGDDDAAWEAIIAGWDLTAEDPVPRWSAAEDVNPGDPGDPGQAPEDRPKRPADPAPSATVIRPAQTEPVALGPRDFIPEDVPRPPSEDPEDHYVPPPPPPLPRIDPLTKLSWIGVLGAPLWLILVEIFDWTPVEGSGVLALAAFIGGFAGLIYRMKDDRGDGDSDDGAVV